jgi:hypothetical protein
MLGTAGRTCKLACASLRLSSALLVGATACTQPHEIDLAARPTLQPDAVVTVWTRDGAVEITAVRLTDDSIFGRPTTNKLNDPHLVGFELKKVSRLVLTQAPAGSSVATQAAIIVGLGALVLAFLAAVAAYDGGT